MRCSKDLHFVTHSDSVMYINTFIQLVELNESLIQSMVKNVFNHQIILIKKSSLTIDNKIIRGNES